MRDRQPIHGSLRLELRGPGGEVLAVRRVDNTIMRGGAELIATVFTATPTRPISGMAVGTSVTPNTTPYEIVALKATDDDNKPLLGGTTVSIPAENVTVETLASEFRVLVSLRAVLPKEAAVRDGGAETGIAEAALGILSDDGKSLSKIYNRVVFDPVPKGPEHELALYWEVSFPYGA